MQNPSKSQDTATETTSSVRHRCYTMEWIWHSDANWVYVVFCCKISGVFWLPEGNQRKASKREVVSLQGRPETTCRQLQWQQWQFAWQNQRLGIRSSTMLGCQRWRLRGCLADFAHPHKAESSMFDPIGLLRQQWRDLNLRSWKSWPRSLGSEKLWILCLHCPMESCQATIIVNNQQYPAITIDI